MLYQVKLSSFDVYYEIGFYSVSNLLKIIFINIKMINDDLVFKITKAQQKLKEIQLNYNECTK